jgi:hypothetical protein
MYIYLGMPKSQMWLENMYIHMLLFIFLEPLIQVHSRCNTSVTSKVGGGCAYMPGIKQNLMCSGFGLGDYFFTLLATP